MTQTDKGWREEFDKEFTRNDPITGEKKMKMFCVTNRTLQEPVFKEEDEMVTKHKAFISKVESEAYKRAVEVINGQELNFDAKTPLIKSAYIKGRNDAVKAIEQLTK